jgi:hypothetical protein
MKQRTSIVSILVLLALSFSSLTSANSETVEAEQWLTPNRYEPGFQGIIISDSVISYQMYSMLTAISSSPAPGSVHLCSSTNSLNCETAPSFKYNAVLGACDEKRLIDCITSVQSKDKFGNLNSATFDSEVNPNHVNRYIGDPSLRIPDGAEPSIWNLPSAPHPGGIQYAVIAGLNGGTNRTSPTPPNDFYAYLFPVEKVTTGFIGSNIDGFSFTYPQCIQKSLGEIGQARTGCRGNFDSGVGNPPRKCLLFIENGPDCYVQRPFPEDFTFNLKFNIKDSLKGWLHGRMLDPQISISSTPGIGTSISISAKPINIPIFYYGDLYKNLPQELKDAYSTRPNLSGGGSYGRICCEYNPDPNLRNSTSTPWSFGDDSIDEMKRWLSVAGDKSVAEPSAWSVRTLSSVNTSTSCFVNGDGLKGLVTTNSTTYSDGPPRFTNEELQYRVASPHLSSSGKENLGSYNLLIRSDVAKCLYGFSDNPIQATVMVTKSDGGTSNIATELITMKDGWLKLSAKNFTFSDPTIRIKLSQNVSLPSPTATSSAAEPIKTIQKKTSITCFKGKFKKVITGIKPVCPPGYKTK